jgi:hypothetical protein
MRRTVPLLLGLAFASGAAAQGMTAPGSPGGGVNPFETNLAGRIVGFGDGIPGGAAVSGPAAAGTGVSSSPVNISPGTFPAGGFHTGGLFFPQPSTGTPGVEFATAPATNGTANGGFGAGATPTGTTGAATRKTPVFVGVGARRLGFR